MLRNFDFLSDFYIISKIFKNIFMKIPTKISEKIVTQNPYLKVLEKNLSIKAEKQAAFSSRHIIKKKPMQPLFYHSQKIIKSFI